MRAAPVHPHQNKPSLSVIVPLGPGDALAPRLQTQLAQLPDGAQWRLVCAADDERSVCTIAPEVGRRCEIIRAARGRASQQNAGARGARGEWLWFLHADSVLSAQTLPTLLAFMQRGHAGAGYHDLRFLDDGPVAMRLTELGVFLRSHVLGLPFGDQGLLLRRDVFESVGGFDPLLQCGEDHDLVWRLRRAGYPPRPIGAILYTSARKYVDHGWCATTFGHVTETLRQAWRFSRAEATR